MEAQPPVSFNQAIQPILETRCIGCHSLVSPQAKLALNHHTALMEGGESGPVIVAGNSGKSLLVSLVSGPNPMMPKAGAPLTTNEISLIQRWIAEGAINDGLHDEGVWWSFQPLTPGAVPDLVDRLLASPRYGERWGRHWLDVVHYGESHGYDKDKARKHSWL